MKILFLSCGNNRSSGLEYILEKRVELIGIILPSARKDGSVKKTALKYGVPIYPVEKDNFNIIIKDISFDLIISCGFPYIIDFKCFTKDIVAINVHPSLLPKYRYHGGPHVLINGEEKSGITVHYMNEKVDGGDIIEQREFKLTPFDTKRSMNRKWYAIEGPVLYSAIKKIKDEEVKAIHQDAAQATEYRIKRKPEDSEIDPQRPLLDLYNQIRACDPDDYPAYFYVEGQKVCIGLWRQDKPGSELDMI
jgi:methionyl-tRNA formyltransferase